MMNNKLNILVTGAGGDIGIAIVKILKSTQICNILIGCDINEYPGSMSQLDFFYSSPRADSKEYITFIDSLIEKHDVSLMIPSSEQEILVFSKLDNPLNKEVRILVNNKMIVDTFMDKQKTIDFFIKNSIKHPRTFDLCCYTNQLNYPFLLKQKFSKGGEGIFKIENTEDFLYYSNKYSNLIAQEIIGKDKDEYTVGVFSDGEVIHHIAFKRVLGYGSLSKFVQRITDSKIDNLVYRIVKATKLKGSINIQLRKDDFGEYVPFEINPRLSSTLAFRHYFGFKDLIWWIDLVFGFPIERNPKFLNGVGVKIVDEIYFDLEGGKDEKQ